MSLRNDRVLSMAMRYALHRLTVTSSADKNKSAMAFNAYASQFGGDIHWQMTTVYLLTLAGSLVEDRRSRGRQLW